MATMTHTNLVPLENTTETIMATSTMEKSMETLMD